jgi:H+/Cl- antiporter ClcA
MNQQLREKTWKHFWEQKLAEVGTVLLILFIIWSILGVIFQIGWVCEPKWNGGECIVYESSLPIWMMISGFITTGIWIIVGFVYWIRTNWEEALEEAKEDIKKERRLRRVRKK